MEFLEKVTENNVPTGEFINRKDVIEKGYWCRSTNVFVVNHKGEILCQQRSLSKERYPGVWLTHLGGHVSQGETYETNAVKELVEEAGINIEGKNLIPWRITRRNKERLWIKEFVAFVEVNVADLKAQPGEVEKFEWKTPEQIIKESRGNPDKWLAGTHDFLAEYQCLRAVLTAIDSIGISPARKHLHTWHPPLLALG